jgi:ribonuclease III
MPRRSAPSRTPPTTSTSTARPEPAGRRTDAAPPTAGDAAALAARLGLDFADLELLGQALVHSSFTNDHPELPRGSNQRLEFLGDSVVSLIVADALYRQHPDEHEGSLTARRAAMVSTAGLSRLAERIGLGDFIVLGEGAERAGERTRSSVLESGFEAVVAAVYVEFGFEKTRTWLLQLAGPELAERPAVQSLKSPKSRLLEASQALTGRPPTYRVLSVEGPDHARRYEVEAMMGGAAVGKGSGPSRREAETEAAAAALERIEQS